MKKTYKITFKPAEPYFFGNEKNFVFPGQDVKSAYSSSYFIKSEETPSQTTILGALRYIFLAYKKTDFNYEKHEKKANNEIIGEKSFDIDSAEKQEFGIIKSISPVFICGKDESGESVTLIPTPMDHNRADKKAAESETEIKEPEEQSTDPQKKDPVFYSPFEEYLLVNTSECSKLYAIDFDVKEGLERSYMSVPDGKIYSKKELFKNDLRIGINRSSEKDGFFKKEYKMLEDGFSFAVYAELDIEAYCKTAKNPIDITKPQYVFLGQGKSAFSVTFTEETDLLQKTVEDMLKGYKRTDHTFIYCLSDSFVSNFENENILFCALDTKDYRAFKTMEKGKIEKGGNLYRLLKAGSIIIAENSDAWIKNNTNENAKNIGFNTFIKIGGKNNESECL